MSYKKSFLGDLVADGYGKPKQSAADYYWDENPIRIDSRWKPQIKWPQLEELLDVFNGSGIPIAGGSILGCLEAIEFGDIDIFPLKEEDIYRTCDALDNLGYRPDTCELEHVKQYVHSASVYRPVQVITVHADAHDVYQLLARFDLSCVQVAVVDGRLHSYKTALKDIQDRYLRVGHTLAVRTLLDRIIKYKNRGFKFYDEEKAKEEKTKMVHG